MNELLVEDPLPLNTAMAGKFDPAALAAPKPAGRRGSAPPRRAFSRRGPARPRPHRIGGLVDVRADAPLLHPGFLPQAAAVSPGRRRGRPLAMRASFQQTAPSRSRLRHRAGRRHLREGAVSEALRPRRRDAPGTFAGHDALEPAFGRHGDRHAGGPSALAKTNAKLMANRRVSGAQRILEAELEGMIPIRTACGLAPGGAADRLLRGRAGNHAAGVDVLAAAGLARAAADYRDFRDPG